MPKVDNKICFNRCYSCKEKIYHPPILIPIGKPEPRQDAPGAYTFPQASHCCSCTLKLSKGGLFRSAKLEKLEPDLIWIEKDGECRIVKNTEENRMFLIQKK